MTNIASLAKAGTVDVALRIDFLEAMESAKIDRSGTCFQGFGYLACDDLARYMEELEEMWAETPW